jgi:hypothetical protein
MLIEKMQTYLSNKCPPQKVNIKKQRNGTWKLEKGILIQIYTYI